MDLTKVLAQLHAELENLDAAIAGLERLQPQSPRRGRPPKSAVAAKPTRIAAGKRGADLRSMDPHRENSVRR
jgi:hypothetical protein